MEEEREAEATAGSGVRPERDKKREEIQGVLGVVRLVFGEL